MNYYFILLIIIILVIVALVKFQTSKISQLPTQQYNISYISTLPVYEIANLISLNENLKKEPYKEEVNSILDKEFKLRCHDTEIISLETVNIQIVPICNYEFFHHYLEAKIKLGMMDEILKNERIIFILNNTYNTYKHEYANKIVLSKNENIWSHIIVSLKWLGMFDKKEKEFWIVKYSTLEFNESEPKFPQSWGRIWILMWGFDVKNVDDLQNYNLNFTQAVENICGYTPALNSLKHENIYNENEACMMEKYLIIKRFCNMKLTHEDFDELKNIISKEFNSPTAMGCKNRVIYLLTKDL